MMENDVHTSFTLPLLSWYAQHGRHDLPWKKPLCAYRIWLSEIMLQQTQVKTVIPYFNRFLARFPSLDSLALSTEDEVLRYWAGLGYYSRGRNLHKTAIIIQQQFQGIFPRNIDDLMTLPGVGPSTAAAIASLAYDEPTAILDGNVQRILCRFFLIDGVASSPQVKNKLWEIAKSCMPTQQCADYTQAIMDLGATCCRAKNPSCEVCPLQRKCSAYQQQCVDAYPEKKPKKVVPLKTQRFLILYTDDLIYLEKQPSEGLWGGLWRFPAIDHDTCLQEHLNALNLVTYQIDTLALIKHCFTHFHLHITPHFIKTRQTNLNGEWFSFSEVKSLAVPKPVQSLLDAFWKMTAIDVG